jgi:hypothetical protein
VRTAIRTKEDDTCCSGRDELLAQIRNLVAATIG